MGLLVRAPRHMVENKPRHGLPCNRCGLCCWTGPCALGKALFKQTLGPCPALQTNDDGTTSCGIVNAPEIDADLREAAHLIVRSGQGCDSRINGEARDLDFDARLDRLDAENANKIAAARALWGLD